MSGKLMRVTPGKLLASFFGNRDNDFFNEFLEESALPAVNVTENSDAFILELAVPGFSKEDIDIECNGHVLTVSADRQSEKDETDRKGKILRREFSSSSFSRSFTLDENIDAGNISAHCREGVLVIVLPKSHETIEDKAKRIEIS